MGLGETTVGQVLQASLAHRSQATLLSARLLLSPTFSIRVSSVAVALASSEVKAMVGLGQARHISQVLAMTLYCSRGSREGTV